MTTNTESYEMKQVMRRVAACLTAPMHELGGRCLWLPSAWTEDNIPHLVDDSRWRTTLGRQKFPDRAERPGRKAIVGQT